MVVVAWLGGRRCVVDGGGGFCVLWCVCMVCGGGCRGV
jgi:hypothetical protein